MGNSIHGVVLRCTLLVVVLSSVMLSCKPAVAGELATSIKRFKTDVFVAPEFDDERRQQMRDMWRSDVRRRLNQANRQSTRDWQQIKDRHDWEAYRASRINALRSSLGKLPTRSPAPMVLVTGTIDGDGFRIDNIVFESRPGLWVTANLYLPAEATETMPGIVVCHSHHRPKDHGELQDMGMTWARAGCAVLIPDQLGHGERGIHPFRNASDYEGEFRVSRQDYYFRYDAGIQLHLLGESLTGWMAWDLMRAIDVLVARNDVDAKRIILLGAVAGGGDPAAVVGALDDRIAAAVPFNFGGPQGFTRYPLPENAEQTFNYAGSGGWESTRNLRLSCVAGRDFLPWAIVAGIAPRRLIYAHEFRWDRPRDPVWKRLETIYGWYDAGDRLAFSHGKGHVKLRPPEATHCTHIGRVHRRMIHPHFERWFGIVVKPEDEYSQRLESERLRCLTPEARESTQPRPFNDVVRQRARQQLVELRRRDRRLSQPELRRELASRWRRVLGGRIENPDSPKPRFSKREQQNGIACDRVALSTGPGITVPLVVVMPSQSASGRRPVVVAVAQGGKRAFLDQRAPAIAKLLERGVAVCLPDLRGCGETSPSSDRGRYAAATSISSSELMLGGTTLAARLRDLRAVVAYLRGRDDLDADRVAVWGASLTKTNPPQTNFRIPRRIDGRPQIGEPAGGLLAVLAALFDEQLAGICVDRGLISLASVVGFSQVHIPHDVVVPGALEASDLSDVVAAIAPCPTLLNDLVTARNQPADRQACLEEYFEARRRYDAANAAAAFTVGNGRSPAEWFAQILSNDAK